MRYLILALIYGGILVTLHSEEARIEYIDVRIHATTVDSLRLPKGIENKLENSDARRLRLTFDSNVSAKDAMTILQKIAERNISRVILKTADRPGASAPMEFPLSDGYILQPWFRLTRYLDDSKIPSVKENVDLRLDIRGKDSGIVIYVGVHGRDSVSIGGRRVDLRQFAEKLKTLKQDAKLLLVLFVVRGDQPFDTVIHAMNSAYVAGIPGYTVLISE